MTYADLTVLDRNPVKRWLQNRRFTDALKVFPPAGSFRDEVDGKPARAARGGRLRVLDYGAGDGELVRRMAGMMPLDAWIYEPIPQRMAEAREKLAHVHSVTFLDALHMMEPGVFDYVFCLEVLEHLPEAATDQALGEIHRLLKPTGRAVIGVPHELFLPALLKGLFRMSRRYGDFDALPGNVWAALRGRPPTRRPVEEIAPGVHYHRHHLGFDYRQLERRLAGRFRVTRKWFSPFPSMGAPFNMEVCFLVEKDTAVP